MKKVLVCVAALVAAANTMAARAASVEAYQNATVQPGGIRAGNNGINFVNIEGATFGNFSSYAVARFDVSAIKSAFDAQYGAGGWVVDTVALALTQSNASFTNDGTVGIHFTGDDAVSILAGTGSPLAYPLAGDFGDLQPVASYTFTEVATGTLETHDLYSRGLPGLPGRPALAADILNDSVVTLVLGDGSTGVAATYAGYNNNTYAGPTLTITAAPVPEPSEWLLLAGGLALLCGATRRPQRRDGTR